MEKIIEMYQNIKEIKGSYWLAVITVFSIFNLIFIGIGIKEMANSHMLIVMYIIFIYSIIKNILHELEMVANRKTELKKEMKPADLEKCAFHEAGHAIIARYLKSYFTIKELTIINNFEKNYGGYMHYGYNSDVLTKNALLGEIKICFGGMVAEKLIYGEHSSGVCKDIIRAQDIVVRMLRDYAMGNDIIYGTESEKALKEADAILKEQLADVTQIMNDNEKLLYLLKEELLVKKEMNQEEIEKFFSDNGI